MLPVTERNVTDNILVKSTVLLYFYRYGERMSRSIEKNCLSISKIEKMTISRM